MGTHTNEEIIKAMLQKGGSPVLENYLKNVDLKDGDNLYKMLDNSPSMKNEFIQTLVNRVVKTRFFSKVFENPLKMFHNGDMNFGNSIQDIFVEFGERKGFKENFTREDGSKGSEESDLISKRTPKVVVDYETENYEYTYKVSVSEEQLQKAFLNNNGLQSLCVQLINNNLSTAERDEFSDMKAILCKVTDKTPTGDKGNFMGKGAIQRVFEDTELSKTAIVKLGKNYTPQSICETIREYATELKFPSKLYNLKKVETWSDTSDLVFITIPKIIAKMDVNVLAEAFNIDKADAKVRKVPINNSAFPKLGTDNILGVLVDKWLIQSFDTVNKTGTMNVASSLTINNFLHRHGIRTYCPFAQMIIITDGDPTQA